MKAFILAGGFATRLWPLTEKRAKPMLLVDGKPILEHILNQIPATVEVFLLTNSQFESDFSTFLKTQKREVTIFCEDTHCDDEKLGALAAVATAIDYYNIEDDILVLAGDNLLPELSLSDLFPVEGETRLAVKTVPDLESAKAFGVIQFTQASPKGVTPISAFDEKPEHPQSTFVSTGFMGISQSLLPTLKSFAKVSPDALGAIITEFLKQNYKVSGLEVAGDWFDVGSYEAYLSAHKTMQTESIKIHSTAWVKDCQFQGKVYIGAGAVIENCTLIDTIIYADTQIKNSHISQCVIDQNCEFFGVDLSRKLIRQGTKVNSVSV
jgi:glucose-1-phosphate thymidylyltransferase